MDGSQLEPGAVVELPAPETDGSMAVEAAMARRRSRREIAGGSLDCETVGQLLWAAQGITDEQGGFRTAPSAGATFPLEAYLLVGADGVPDLDPGVYAYRPAAHALELQSLGDVRADLRAVALDQSWLETAPVTVVLASVDERTAQKYGERAPDRYVPMEAGHAGQNLYLQVESLGLATVAVGAFEDEAVGELLGLDADERPLYLFPVGGRVDAQ